jgi:hypothetical protein
MAETFAAGSGQELTRRITAELHKRVVGQEQMIERLLIGLLTGGHVLLEGVPGLAKTLTVKSSSPSPKRFTLPSSASSSHPTCCPPMSSAR